MRNPDKKPITAAQRFLLLIDHRDKKTGRWCESLWTAACRAQGWNKSDRSFRLQQFSLILGRPIESAGQIGYLTEFDAIKERLLAWAQPGNLDAQMEMQNMPRKRLIMRILEFPASYTLGLLGSPRFRSLRGVDPDQLPALEDMEHMTEKDLKDLRNTLCARNPGNRGSRREEALNPHEPCDYPCDAYLEGRACKCNPEGLSEHDANPEEEAHWEQEAQKESDADEREEQPF